MTVADPKYVPYHWCDEVTSDLVVGQRDGLVYLDVSQPNGLVSLTAAERAAFEAAYAEAKRRADAPVPGETVG